MPSPPPPGNRQRQLIRLFSPVSPPIRRPAAVDLPPQPAILLWVNRNLAHAGARPLGTRAVVRVSDARIDAQAALGRTATRSVSPPRAQPSCPVNPWERLADDRACAVE